MQAVITTLLSRGYLLTALELLIEAEEANRPEEVDQLRLFFADQSKFPPEEVASYLPSDGVNLAKLARQREERLELVEYQLRIAQEEAEAGPSTQDGDAASPHAIAANGLVTVRSTGEDQSKDIQAAGSEAIDARQAQQLNTAVRDYLAAQGLKLSAMTLAEEGKLSAASAAPEPLTAIWQGHQEQQAAMQAAQSAEADKLAAEDALETASRQTAELQDSLHTLRQDYQRLQALAEDLQEQLDRLQPQQQTEGEMKAVHPVKAERAAEPAIKAGPGRDDALQILADQLPKIVPSLLIGTRHEVLPALEAVISAVGPGKRRERLVYTLFNLVKRPTAPQREAILASLVRVAKQVGEAMTADELLAQCWEQAHHRHAERRLLVAEACRRLAPCVPPVVRASLLFSILRQMAGDGDAPVRAAVVGTVAQMLTGLPSDKLNEVLAVMLECTMDSTHLVVDAVLEDLLPALLRWLPSPDLLWIKVVPTLFDTISHLLERCPVLMAPGGARRREVHDPEQRQVHSLLRLNMALLPTLQAAALQTAPDWVPWQALPADAAARVAEDGSPAAEPGAAADVAEGSSPAVTDQAHLLAHGSRPGTAPASSDAAQCEAAPGPSDGPVAAAFAAWLTCPQHAGWAAVEWLVTVNLPQLLSVIMDVAPSSSNEALRRRLSAAAKALCLTCGPAFTAGAVAPLFAAAGGLPADALDAGPPWGMTPGAPEGAEALQTQAVLPILLAGVLPAAAVDGTAGTSLLRRLLLGNPDWTVAHLQDVAAAARFGACIARDLHPSMISLLWELTVCPLGPVKACCAALCGALAHGLPHIQVGRHLLPVLETLTHESQPGVQAQAVAALGDVWSLPGLPGETARRLEAHLDTLMQEGLQVQADVVTALSRYTAAADELQLEYILQKALLMLVAVHQRGGRDGAEGIAARAAFQVLRALSAREVASNSVQLHLVAALQALAREGDLLSPAERDILAAMLRDASKAR